MENKISLQNLFDHIIGNYNLSCWQEEAIGEYLTGMLRLCPKNESMIIDETGLSTKDGNRIYVINRFCDKNNGTTAFSFEFVGKFKG